MKVQLDTEHKTIKLEKDVKLSKLVEFLESILPDGKWKEFTLETNTTIQQWSSPIVIREYPRPYYGPWWGTPYTMMGTGSSITNSLSSSAVDASASHSLQSGVYNMELKA